MIFSHDFRGDCLQLLEALEGPPIALTRFCDGEYAILNTINVHAADGWTVPLKNSLFTRMLRDSLVYDDEGYHIGISPPCCLPDQYDYYMREMKIPFDRVTFANVFVDGNHGEVIDWVKRKPVLDKCAIVSCSPMADYRIPRNAVNNAWDLSGLITRLKGETRPILVAGGPAANIIIHQYWMCQELSRRVCIYDIGSVFDVWMHGCSTRGYHKGDNPNRKKVCTWTTSQQS